MLKEIFWFYSNKPIVHFGVATFVFLAVFSYGIAFREHLRIAQISLLVLGIWGCHLIAQFYKVKTGELNPTNRPTFSSFHFVRSTPKALFVTYLLSGTSRGNVIALVAFLSICVFEFSTNSRSFSDEIFSHKSFERLAYYIFLIALMEEAWFRGVLFWAARASLFGSFFGATVLFAAIHYPLGGTAGVLSAFAIGSVYASLRLCGASIITLAIVHGGINWFYTMATSDAGPSLFGRGHSAMGLAFNMLLASIFLCVAIVNQTSWRENLSEHRRMSCAQTRFRNSPQKNL